MGVIKHKQDANLFKSRLISRRLPGCTSMRQFSQDFLIMCCPLLAVLQLGSRIRVLLPEDVEESRVYLVRQVAGLQAAALCVESEPGALLI